MHSRVRLSHPLKINVARIASYFPELRYRGPFTGVTSEWILNDANSKKMQVLLFDDKNEAGFNMIKSSCSPKELAVLFSKLPTDLSTVLIEALKGTELAIPTISEHEQKEIMAAHEPQRAVEPEAEIAPQTGTICLSRSSNYLKKEDIEFHLERIERELTRFTPSPLMQCNRVGEKASSAPKNKSSISSGHYATGLTTFNTVTPESAAKTPLLDTSEIDNSHCHCVIL